MLLDKPNQRKYKYIYINTTIDKFPSVDVFPKFASFLSLTQTKSASLPSLINNFLFLLMLLINQADRYEKRKIEKEQRIKIENLRRRKINKKHATGNVSRSFNRTL